MGSTYIAIIFFAVAVSLVLSHSLFLEKRLNNPDYFTNSKMDPKKRPFCNAFTGCGRKRSNFPPIFQNALDQEPFETENLGTLLDLSAEPAVEDLSRQIMSEAKLWEAIQEAHKEIMRERQQTDGEEIPAVNPLAGATSGVGVANGKCALPSCIAI